MAVSTPFTQLLSERMTAQSLDRMKLLATLHALDARVSRQAVDGWCNGDFHPHPDRFHALSQALGCTRAQLALAVAGVDEDQPGSTPSEAA